MSLFLLVWSLCCCGFLALAAAMSKHQKQIFKRQLAAKHNKLASLLGWCLLFIAMLLCLSAGSISNMLSYYLGVLSFAALAVALAFSYLEQHLKKLALAWGLLIVLSAISYYLL